MAELTIESPEFKSNEHIPEKYTCDGEGVSPPLSIAGVPSNAKSLVLIVDDPDAPSGTFVHWVVWNIQPATRTIDENSVPGIEGLNSGGENSYVSPCPPSGTHRYFFKVYALDTKFDLPQTAKKADVEKAMKGHVLSSGQTVGLYTRRST